MSPTIKILNDSLVQTARTLDEFCKKLESESDVFTADDMETVQQTLADASEALEGVAEYDRGGVTWRYQGEEGVGEGSGCYGNSCKL